MVDWIGAGIVFDKFRNLNTNHTLPNVGIGYRWEFKNRVNAREGGGVYFNINEAF